jgi:hypothetical protein
MRFPLSTHSRFIPASQIDDVFIHEGFKGFQVRHYLAVVVHGEEQLEVVFPVLPLPEAVLMGETVTEEGGIGTHLEEHEGSAIQGRWSTITEREDGVDCRGIVIIGEACYTGF